MAYKLHSLLCPAVRGHIDRGAILWNLTGDNVAIKPRRTLLPVLTVLFVVSYGLLTMLVVEQGRTIDSQRGLIQVLFNDSVQLSNLKGMAIQKKQAEARAQKRCSGAAESTVAKPGYAAGGNQEPRYRQGSQTAPTEASA